MTSWNPKNVIHTFCMICQFVSLKGRVQEFLTQHYFIKYIFKNSNSISNNVYLEMFTYSWPAFDKYLIALQQKNFLLFENTAEDMVHLVCRSLSMRMHTVPDSLYSFRFRFLTNFQNQTFVLSAFFVKTQRISNKPSIFTNFLLYNQIILNKKRL